MSMEELPDRTVKKEGKEKKNLHWFDLCCPHRLCRPAVMSPAVIGYKREKKII